MRNGIGIRLACIIVVVALVSAMSGRAQAALPSAKEQTQQQDEYQENAKHFKGYYFGDVIAPKYRKAGKTQIAPLVKKLEEYEGSMAAKLGGLKKSEWLSAQCEGLAVLSLFEDESASKQLEEMKSSKDPIIAINGTMGVWLRDWWKEPTEENQKPLIEQARKIAADNPKEDAVARMILSAEQFGAANDELSAAGREIVEKDLKGLVAAQYRARPNKVGEPLIINGRATNTKMFSTASWKGKVILVDFWATWCPPCRESLPELSQLYTQYHDQGLEIVGVNCDMDLQALKGFLAEHKTDMPWPQLFGPTPPYGFHTLAKSFHIDGIPTMYLIDRNGILHTTQARSRLQRIIPDLLAEKAAAWATTKPVK